MLVHLGCHSVTNTSRSSLHSPPPRPVPSKHILDTTSMPLSEMDLRPERRLGCQGLRLESSQAQALPISTLQGPQRSETRCHPGHQAQGTPPLLGPTRKISR